MSRYYGVLYSFLEQGLRKLYRNGTMFNVSLLFTMCLNLAIYNVLTAYSRQSDTPYYPTTVVLLAEILKLIVSISIVWLENQRDANRVWTLVKTEMLDKPKEFGKLLIPATIYALQNNLVYVVLTNMEPTMFQVLTNLKIFTTALFMRILLGYNLSGVRCLALFTLFCGVGVVQVGPSTPSSLSSHKHNNALGLTGVAVISICSGFAGVYFEKQLKQNTVPFWIRNIEMYVWGVVASASGLLIREGTHIYNKGFFQGYTPLIWMIIFLEGAGGLYVSLVMRHLDNMYRILASSVGIVLTGLGSSLVLGMDVSVSFLIGSLLVCVSVFLYSLPPQHQKTTKNAKFTNI